MSRTSTAMVALALSTFVVPVVHASQGPGIADDTASATVQLAMTIIVYGGSALLIAWGVIGAIRHR
ncbi:hypothetical protein [Tardiphaga sp.]|uniref:hypothetical protein n=1 Tax=Tardiphaga sp. TaxID=1926292 RepID=UPI00260810D5|nr:hypothetical protein [Tardiphaga sp.]MDB5618208.1 hypothetical protein [Tardiphaga sp.]